MKDVYVDLRNESNKVQNCFEKDLASVEDLLNKIEDLLFDIEHLEEEYSDLQNNLEYNYRPIPISEQVGVYDSDFI